MIVSSSRRDEAYFLDGNVHRLRDLVEHREYEYDSAGFDILDRMQREHFWYRGRHRFLLSAVRTELKQSGCSATRNRAVDLGGGCGGWIRYLVDHSQSPFQELALADSSLTALRYARRVVPPSTLLYQSDLLRLGWTNRWDVAFLLDVLEHIPDEVAVLKEIHRAIVPGGLLFVTTPALNCFWTWNDEAAHHQRRYNKLDFRRLADHCGFELLESRYFMFLLSPLMMAVRWLARLRYTGRRPTPNELKSLANQTHRVPAFPINELLSLICAAETPLGHRMSLPWGTSILAILRRL